MSIIIPAKLQQHVFDVFMCLDNLVLEDFVKSREETLGWPQINELSDAESQADGAKLRQATHP